MKLLFSRDRCERLLAELDRSLAISASQYYRDYRDCVGILPTQQFNQIWAALEDEELHSALFVIAAPPGSGKTFLLHTLREEFEKSGRGPVIFRMFSGDRESFASFTSNFEAELVQSIGHWVNRVTGREIHYGCPPAAVLSLLATVREVARQKIPVLILLDEAPADVDKLEQLLRRVASYGLDPYVVISLHELKDLDAVIKGLASKGGIGRFSKVEYFKAIELAPGHDEVAREFFAKIVGGRWDEVAEQVALEMLHRGFGIRSVISFLLGIRRPVLSGPRLQSAEVELHKRIVGALGRKLKTASPEACRLKTPSRPDLVLADCTCVEVKVRKGGREDVNPAQHICDRLIYIVVSPIEMKVPGAEVIHIKVDVERLLSGYEAVVNKMHDAAGEVLSLVAEIVAEEAVKEINKRRGIVEKTHLEVAKLCATLREAIKGEGPVTRSQLTKSSPFKALIKELAEKPTPYKDKLLECAKRGNPPADCVDLFAKATQTLYKASVLKIVQSYVYLGDVCTAQRPPITV